MYVWPFELPLDGVRDAAIPASASVDALPRAAPGLPAGLKDFLLENLPGRRIVLPGDPAYDTARKTFNPRFNDLRPWAVVFCAAEQDLRICLEGMRAYKAPFRLRSAGHTFAGYSSLDDGVVIDVSGLSHVDVDPLQLRAVVESGCRMGDLQKALSGHGLQLPLGGNPVGVGGFVQGGGFGENSRTFGMNSDNVLAARVMLADGRTVHASETVNHDLWWAIRGGTGGNFGVLVKVQYALHRAPDPNEWSFAWPIRQPADRKAAVDALATLQDKVLAGAGPELNAGADLRYWPDSAGGRPTTLRLYVWGNYFGSQADMEALVRPLAVLPGQEDFTLLGSKPLPVLRQARFVTRLAPPDWKTLVDDFADHCNLFSTMTMNAWGGAIESYPSEASAFIHRNAVFNVYVTGFWDGPVGELKMQAYLKRWRDFIAPFWTQGIYQDFADADCPDYRSNYWGAAFPALVAVKRKYDPDGLFAFPQAICARPGKPEPVTWPPKVVAWLDKAIEA